MARQMEQADPKTTEEIVQTRRSPTDGLDRQLLSETVHERVAQAIQPVLANVQDRIAALVQEHLRNELRHHPLLQPGDASNLLTEDGQAIAFPVLVNAERAEDALRKSLGAALEVLFSDGARAGVEEQATKSTHVLLAAARSALPEESDREKLQRRADRELQAMLDELFSRPRRDRARRQGERVVRELVKTGVPSAREEAEGALQSLLEQWSAVTFEYWEKVARMVIRAVEDVPSRQNGGKERDGKPASTPEPQAEDALPQTLLRSDQRAQEIWKKARDRAASDGDAERSGERAAYEALKQHYEKKGDHWVKRESTAHSKPASARASSARRGKA